MMSALHRIVAWRPWVVAGLLYAATVSPIQAETLTLADCLRETVDHNPTIRREQAAIERATASRLTLRARSLPSLGIGGIVGQLGEQDSEVIRTRTKDPKTGTVVTKEVVAVERPATFIALGTGTLNQSIFDAAIPAAYRRGTVEVIAAQQNFYTVVSAQLHAARILFYRALYQRENDALLRRADALLAEDVQAQNSLVSAGLAGRGGLLNAQVQRANFSPVILSAGGTYRTTLAQLLQTMGRDPGDGAEPLSAIHLAGEQDESLRAFNSADATHQALERRPDLRSLRALVKLYTEDANILRGGYYPLIRLYVAGEILPGDNVRSNTPNAVRQSDQEQTTEIRPGIREDWIIIDTGAVRGGVRQAEATRSIMSLNLQRLERNVPAELAAVRARLDDAARTVATLRGNVEVAQNTLKIVQTGVAQGVNSQLEFFDAQGGLVDTRTGLLAAQLEMSLAHAEFDRITGNYLQYVPEETRSAVAATSKPTLKPVPSPTARPSKKRP